MATIGTLNAKLTLQNASFSRGIRGAIAQTATLQAAFIRTGHGVRNLAGAILGLAGVGGFTHLIREGFKAGSELQDLTMRTGTTAIAFEALRRSAELSGTEVGQLSTAMQRMLVNTTKAAEGSDEAAVGFKLLGLNAKELLSLKPDKQFVAIGDAMKRLENPALRARAAFSIFGRAGAELIPVLMEGSKGIEESRKRIIGLGIGITAIDVTKLDTAADAMSDIGRVVKGIGRQLALSLAPILGVLAERFVHFAEAGSLAGGVVSKSMETGKTLMFGFAQLLDKVTIGFLHMAAAADVAHIATRKVVSNVSSNFAALQNRGQKFIGAMLAMGGNPKLGIEMMKDADAAFGGTAAGPDKQSEEIRTRIAGIRSEIEKINEGGPGSMMGTLFDWLQGINNQFGDMVLHAAELRAKLGGGLGVEEFLEDKKKKERFGGGMRVFDPTDIALSSQRGRAGGAVSRVADKQIPLLEKIALTLGRIEKRNAGMAA